MSGLFEDFANKLAPSDDANSIKPQIITGNTNGAAVDLDGRHDCAAIAHLGACTGLTSASVKLQECATASGTFTDVPSAVFPAFTAQDKFRVLNFKRSLRFCRAVVTLTGTSATIAVSIVGAKRTY